MSLFDDVTLSYEDKEYIIPSNKVMQLIEVIEDCISITILCDPKVPRAKLAKAYAAAINFAGGKTTQEEVYASFFTNGVVAVQYAVAGLAMLMVPPDHLRDNGALNKELEAAKKNG